MGNAFEFVGSAKGMFTSLSKGSVGKLNTVFAIVDTVNSVTRLASSSYNLYHEKTKTAEVKAQYEHAISALECQIEQEEKRAELLIVNKEAQIVANLTRLNIELQKSKKELELEIKEKLHNFSIEFEKDILSSKPFKAMLNNLELSITNCISTLDAKPDFLDAELEEELRNVIQNYSEVIKIMI